MEVAPHATIAYTVDTVDTVDMAYTIDMALDMISIVTKLPTWLFSVRFVLDLILIITTTLHDWCFPSLRLPVAIYFHLRATIYLHYIPLLLLLLYYSITFLIPDYQNTNLS